VTVPKPAFLSPKELTLQLYEAAASGNADRVRELIEGRAKPDGRPSGEPTPLIAAASRGHVDVIRVLLAEGAGPNFRHGGSREGTTALAEAVQNKQVEAARLLVDAGADVNFVSSTDYSGLPNTPLSMAAELCNRRHADIYGLPILRIGEDTGPQAALDPESDSGQKYTAALDLVQVMLHTGGNIRPGLLTDAAAHGNRTLMRLLLDYGADINEAVHDETPFAKAVEYQQHEAIADLLQAGADPYKGHALFGPPLHKAVAEGKEQIVRAVLQAGVDLNGRSGIVLPTSAPTAPGEVRDEENLLDRARMQDAAPITVAARCRRTEIVRLLAEAGADLELADGDGYTPLGWALRLGDEETAAVLREAGAREPADLAGSPFNKLMLAAEEGDVESAREAIAAGADVNGYRLNLAVQFTPLMAAAKTGSLDIVRELLAAGADPNRGGREDLSVVGITPLMLAARGGHASVVEALIAAGADLHARQVETLGRKRDREQGETALHEAARGGHSAVIRALVHAGGDANVRSRGSGTPLAVAIESGNEDAVNTLLALGAKAGQRPTNLGGSALIAAAGTGDVDAARKLVDAGANPNAASRDGAGPLVYAASNGHAHMVRFLLQSGASPNLTTDRPHSTPLAAAAFGGHDEVAWILLEAGADVNARNSGGSTALHAAVLKGRPDMVERLLEAGADPLAEDDEGHSPLVLANNAVKNCIDEVPPGWRHFGYPLKGAEAEALRTVAKMLEEAAQGKTG
jgi:ankyrin repeat protein